MYFQELNETEKYNGIWACSSILHMAKSELPSGIVRMAQALKENGIIYTSFKYGTFEGERNGRYFTDLTEDAFQKTVKDIEILHIEEDLKKIREQMHQDLENYYSRI